jgi:hypothetical protein
MVPKHRQKSSRKSYQIGHDVLDGKLLLVDVGGVGTTGDGSHGGQVAAVAAHDFLKKLDKARFNGLIWNFLVHLKAFGLFFPKYNKRENPPMIS